MIPNVYICFKLNSILKEAVSNSHSILSVYFILSSSFEAMRISTSEQSKDSKIDMYTATKAVIILRRKGRSPQVLVSTAQGSVLHKMDHDSSSRQTIS